MHRLAPGAKAWQVGVAKRQMYFAKPECNGMLDHAMLKQKTSLKVEFEGMTPQSKELNNLAMASFTGLITTTMSLPSFSASSA